jgi:hypothetical protein
MLIQHLLSDLWQTIYLIKRQKMTHRSYSMRRVLLAFATVFQKLNCGSQIKVTLYTCFKERFPLCSPQSNQLDFLG